MLLFMRMKSSLKLLLVLAASVFCFVQPVKADRKVQAGPTAVAVPDGGATISLLGMALLGVAALRRKLSR
jgi:VPDSG-CTERM motif